MLEGAQDELVVARSAAEEMSARAGGLEVELEALRECVETQWQSAASSEVREAKLCEAQRSAREEARVFDHSEGRVAGEGLRSWRRPQWSGDGEHRRCWREMALVGGVRRVAWAELRRWR